MNNTRSLLIIPALVLSGGLEAESPAPVATPDEGISLERAAAAQFLKPYFNELDCEDLGYVQSGEVDEHLAGVFSSLDRDQSRAVSLKEWQNYPYLKNKPLNEIAFTIADADGNGQVDYRELGDYLVEAIRSLDSDHDDEVYPEDLKRFVTVIQR